MVPLVNVLGASMEHLKVAASLGFKYTSLLRGSHTKARLVKAFGRQCVAVDHVMTALVKVLCHICPGFPTAAPQGSRDRASEVWESFCPGPHPAGGEGAIVPHIPQV